MKRLHKGDEISHREQSILDKEKLTVKKLKPKRLSKAKCGVENPCVFGEWNKSFNKYNV